MPHEYTGVPLPTFGTKFLCQTTMCPIKNEGGDTCMFIVNFEDLTVKEVGEEDEVSGAADNTIQSKFNRARASFRQSFRMGSLRRGRSPAATSSPTPSSGPRMDPIPDQPTSEEGETKGDEDEEDEDEEDEDEEDKHKESGQRDPLLTREGARSHERSHKPSLQDEDKAEAGEVDDGGGGDRGGGGGGGGRGGGDLGIGTGGFGGFGGLGNGNGFNRRLARARDTLEEPRHHSERKISLPLWRRKDSAASRKDSVATTISRCTMADKILGIDGDKNRSRSSMRPATSLDAISQHRVHQGKDNFPARSATISTSEYWVFPSCLNGRVSVGVSCITLLHFVQWLSSQVLKFDVTQEKNSRFDSWAVLVSHECDGFEYKLKVYPSGHPQSGITDGAPRPHTFDNLNTAARNHVTKSFPNASSESDLSRYRTRLGGRDKHSPSLSNLTSEGIKHKFSFQDQNAAKGIFPPKAKKIEKVAQVGQVEAR
ncbi:uncharacterized protein LOC143026800 [Oratosquilla oratoria]|uniref:uncharacterized protein LOC143026800 n=1 Tax=Oratosquilla oratoria TaxID=337810 RepID=UPI003F76C854